MKKTVYGNLTAKDRAEDFCFGNIESGYACTSGYFTFNGKPIIIIIGEFHFSRYDASLWDRELAKIKAQGLDGVSVYVFWNHHEYANGKFDFSGNNDISAFLRLCRKNKLKVVLRIGPWCHGEVRRGGFPDYLCFLPGKRRSTPLYMRYVKRYWQKLYAETAEFFDGETVIGIQLENEYNGNISHISDLRDLAEEVGFRTPFFTMTAWPTNTPDKRFVPMFGGYPEAPWTQHKKPLAPMRRFAIDKGRSETDIGEDLIGKQKGKADFSEFPYATCEIGTGNQVTNHRRPIMSDKDGYGVAFAKFASGANWLGYYMYHGGRNPADRPMQESRRTLYPNNYPLIDYDFQAPISKDGAIRVHGDRLRLLHYAIKNDEEFFAVSEAYFASEKEMPYFSVRSDGERGYLFLSNYERGLSVKTSVIKPDVNLNGNKIILPEISIKEGEILFFPFNYRCGSVTFDYITAQPITSVVSENKTVHYFMKSSCQKVKLSVDGVESEVEHELRLEDAELRFLDEKKALKLYKFNNRVLFSDGALFENDNGIYAELLPNDKVSCGIKNVEFKQESNLNVIFEKTKAVRLKYNSFMFSGGKRNYYKIIVDKSDADRFDDIELSFEFTGLNLQVFKNGVPVDDYFNTDGKFVTRVKRVYDGENIELIIRTVAPTAFGGGNVYNEINLKPGATDLTLIGAVPIKILKIN